MPRKLIIFGNGLGRSLNNDHFDLTGALRTVWNDADYLSEIQKQMIASAIGGVELEDGPETEDQLFGTQLALLACDILKKATNGEGLGHWLTEHAIGFPEALARYNWAVAKHFHNHGLNLDFDDRWQAFISTLVAFIFESKSHIATLNYDDLLYETFNSPQTVNGTEIRLCNGFSGILLDGYTKTRGFSASNMTRNNPANNAWYMHLHGSPLFVDDENGRVKKLTRHQMQTGDNMGRSHIVLTHGSLKEVVISSSKVLQMYWDHLNDAIEEASEILAFGYSGRDNHLNERIKSLRGDTPVRIIERTQPNGRQEFWNSRVGQCTVFGLDDILEFRDW